MDWWLLDDAPEWRSWTEMCSHFVEDPLLNQLNEDSDWTVDSRTPALWEPYTTTLVSAFWKSDPIVDGFLLELIVEIVLFCYNPRCDCMHCGKRVSFVKCESHDGFHPVYECRTDRVTVGKCKGRTKILAIAQQFTEATRVVQKHKFAICHKCAKNQEIVGQCELRKCDGVTDSFGNSGCSLRFHTLESDVFTYGRGRNVWKVCVFCIRKTVNAFHDVGVCGDCQQLGEERKCKKCSKSVCFKRKCSTLCADYVLETMEGDIAIPSVYCCMCLAKSKRSTRWK